MTSDLCCLSFSSARSRAAANGSPWTLTCARTCAFTPETARTCAPLTAATRSLLSPPTSSLTSSRTQRPKTTSEGANGRGRRPAASTDSRPLAVGSTVGRRFTHKDLFTSFLIRVWRLEQETCENLEKLHAPPPPPSSYLPWFIFVTM